LHTARTLELIVRIALAVLLSLSLAGAEEWPFGKGRSLFAQLDLYNLGILGAKASDAARELPANEPPRSGRRSVELGPAGDDEGPDALRVELLHPGGAAAQAGLVKGDVIIGVGAARFSKGSLETLAKALLKAEAGKGEVTLLVRREGKTRKLKVAVPVAGKELSKPTQGKGRRILVDRALRWLADRQEQDGGFAQTLSGTNGAVVQTALAGLAWLGAGSDLEQGPYRENLRRAADFVTGSAAQLGGELGQAARQPGGPSWNQSNWGYAHAAIFLGELHLRTPERGLLEGLTSCAQRLQETQEDSGGWAHGPGGPNALGYLELNIVTGLALSGLGVAHRNGLEVPDAVVKKAEAFLKASSGGGGVGYSDRPGQKGQGNIGRTAGCWLGYVSLGRSRSKFAKSMGAWVKRNAGNVLGGHASLMQHILLAGVAAQAQGGAARRDFWKACRRDLILAHAPDGSFQPRPWHETISGGSNSDVTFGEVWTTAAWTVVLVAEASRDGMRGFPAWCGKQPG
jgi:hypothetical protein